MISRPRCAATSSGREGPCWNMVAYLFERGTALGTVQERFLKECNTC